MCLPNLIKLTHEYILFDSQTFCCQCFLVFFFFFLNIQSMMVPKLGSNGSYRLHRPMATLCTTRKMSVRRHLPSPPPSLATTWGASGLTATRMALRCPWTSNGRLASPPRIGNPWRRRKRLRCLILLLLLVLLH